MLKDWDKAKSWAGVIGVIDAMTSSIKKPAYAFLTCLFVYIFEAILR